MPALARAGRCVVAALLMVTAAAADPVVTETMFHYEVAGATAQEVRADLNRHGPLDGSGKRSDAITRWYVRWTFKYRPAGGDCAITELAAAVNVAILFPRLKQDASISAALRQAFDTFAENLLLHERGHADNAIDAGKRIENAIRTMAPERNCPDLARAANALGHSLVKEANQWDIDYDARTRHGATQGVKFP